MECENCKTEMQISNHGIYIVNQCQTCGNYDDIMPCKDHNMEFVKVMQSDGKFYIKKQCINCGFSRGGGLPKNSVKNLDILPIFNQKLYDERRIATNLISTELQDFKNTKNVNSEKNKFLNEHNKYLQTDTWKKKRLLVLKRDNYLCQSCLEDKATEVHHLSYKFWKNEPLFDLISVCNPCHNNITEMSRK